MQRRAHSRWLGGSITRIDFRRQHASALQGSAVHNEIDDRVEVLRNGAGDRCEVDASLEEAAATLADFRVILRCGPEVGRSATLQAALLTAANIASRCFPSGLRVQGLREEEVKRLASSRTVYKSVFERQGCGHVELTVILICRGHFAQPPSTIHFHPGGHIA